MNNSNSGSCQDESCLFCTIPEERIILENTNAYTILDAFPVAIGHTLIIPRRHVGQYFDMTAEELHSCNDLLQCARNTIVGSDPAVRGFNIGVNVGLAAGQTIFHCHIHLIPRRKGDVEDPRGGIRHVIPGKGYY